MKPTPKQFGQLLIDLRKAAGLKVGTVAKEANVHKTFLFRLERGWEGYPSNHLIDLFARLYGADPDLLYITIGRVPPDLHALAASREGVTMLRQMQREAQR